MNMVLDASPVVFLNPFNGRVDTMPVEMIGAYVFDATHLHLEEAARVACVRDEEAAVNFLQSISESVDELSVEPLSLR